MTAHDTGCVCTHRATVWFGRKLGCNVSINSTSSHTTLMRTGSLLNCFDLSAGQWQLSMIRSGQLLLVKHDFQNATMTHSKLNSCMLVCCRWRIKDQKKKKRSPLSYVFPVCMTTRNHFTGPFCETAGDGTARSLSAGLLLPLHGSASPAALRIVAKRPNFTFPLNPTSVGKSGLREQLRMCHLLHSFLFLFPSLNPSKCVRYSRLLQNSCGKTTCHTPLFHFRGKKLWKLNLSGPTRSSSQRGGVHRQRTYNKRKSKKSEWAYLGSCRSMSWCCQQVVESLHLLVSSPLDLLVGIVRQPAWRGSSGGPTPPGPG